MQIIFIKTVFVPCCNMSYIILFYLYKQTI